MTKNEKLALMYNRLHKMEATAGRKSFGCIRKLKRNIRNMEK